MGGTVVAKMRSGKSRDATGAAKKRSVSRTAAGTTVVEGVTSAKVSR